MKYYLVHEKEWSSNECYNMDETLKCYAKCYKPNMIGKYGKIPLI